jgi:hypothetical protein
LSWTEPYKASRRCWVLPRLFVVDSTQVTLCRSLVHATSLLGQNHLPVETFGWKHLLCGHDGARSGVQTSYPVLAIRP